MIAQLRVHSTHTQEMDECEENEVTFASKAKNNLHAQTNASTLAGV